MENEYVLRLQDHEGYRELFDSCFGAAFDRVLCVRHTGKRRDNPHYHFCLRTTYDKRDSLARHLKKFFTKGKGNKHMSLKCWDGREEALSYLFHEDGGPEMVRGYSEDDIQRLKAMDLKIRESHVKPLDVCEVVLQQINESKTHVIDWGREAHKSRKVVFRFLYQYYLKKGEWMPNKYQMERYINRVRMLVVLQDPDRRKGMEHTYCEQMYDEWFGH